VEESDGAAGGLIREELGEGETGVIIDGDVEELPAGARGVIVLAVAGEAMAGAHDAGELFDIAMDELTRVLAFIAAERRRRLEHGELFGVAAQEARDRSAGDLGRAGDPFGFAQGRFWKPGSLRRRSARTRATRSGWIVRGEH